VSIFTILFDFQNSRLAHALCPRAHKQRKFTTFWQKNRDRANNIDSKEHLYCQWTALNEEYLHKKVDFTIFAIVKESNAKELLHIQPRHEDI
jgi:hypothetical protein